ncbi:hypothetical protein Pth03_32980 [Planotetraspora thailandica]|uniref:Uncharacterized protein n=1 Tax=Planotetraspora thailandica TaxID=487172 RepID=A0A8J3UZD8_9ACTN|nr:hypothetical protein Pth03_32980 [Planotetraspora thailandica]
MQPTTELDAAGEQGGKGRSFSPTAKIRTDPGRAMRSWPAAVPGEEFHPDPPPRLLALRHRDAPRRLVAADPA